MKEVKPALSICIFCTTFPSPKAFRDSKCRLVSNFLRLIDAKPPSRVTRKCLKTDTSKTTLQRFVERWVLCVLSVSGFWVFWLKTEVASGNRIEAIQQSIPSPKTSTPEFYKFIRLSPYIAAKWLFLSCGYTSSFYLQF